MHFRYSKTSMIMNTKHLEDFVSKIINNKIKIKGSIYKFRWKDYTLVHRQKAGYDVIIDFTDAWDERYGGLVFYKDQDGNNNKLLPKPNTLIVVKRKRVQRFFKYVNNLAGKKERIMLRQMLLMV